MNSLVGRKCRCRRAKVLAITGIDGKPTTVAVSQHDHDFLYRVGEWVEEPAYDADIRIECAKGIHFFITRAEAEFY
jgi:hypothetical protein